MIRRYAAEAVGTFFIVFAPVVFAATGNKELLPAALISGLSVLAMISALGPISAAHFNPAVTFGFAVAKRFPWRYVVPYWIAQILGATAAAGVAALLFAAGPGTHVPAEPTLVARNVGIEIAITAMLMLVIIAVATDKRVSGSTPALAIGMAVVVGVLIGGPVTGGSMNPVRSLGPAIFAGGEALGVVWLYLLGPSLGAALGALTYEGLRLDSSHSKGAPNEIWEGLNDIEREYSV